MPDNPEQEQGRELAPIDVHGIWPWTTLRSDSRIWQDRKTHWKDSGVDDLAGRQQVEMFRHGKSGRHHRISGGRSRFDPFLAELAYTWYGASRVIDPFAGGCTRGIIAAELGMDYTGIDLLADQVASNRRIAADWPTVGHAEWVHGDAAERLALMPDDAFGYCLTCPPYHRAERYSDDPRDLSVMGWDEHLDTLEHVAAQLYRVLEDDSFITWVVGDLRAPSGHLRLLPERTALILEEAGFRPVNHQILVTPVGTMFRMIRRWWTNTRSAGRTHQHVLTFVKGDRRRATAKVKRRNAGR
ncbi:DNA methyltransferase [Nesterenkonia suensis]